MNTGYSMCCCAARANEQGERLPPGAPYGVVCGQAWQPYGLSGGLTTASRLRRACTPFLIEKFPTTQKQITIRALSRAHSPGCGSTYLSGKAVQANRATSRRKPRQKCLRFSNHPNWQIGHSFRTRASTLLYANATLAIAVNARGVSSAVKRSLQQESMNASQANTVSTLSQVSHAIRLTLTTYDATLMTLRRGCRTTRLYDVE